MTGTLEGRVALVVGGTKGIGRAISRDLARRGARVYANFAHDEAAAEAARRDLAAEGLAVALCQQDVSIERNASTLLEAVAASAGRIDTVVFTAVDPYLSVSAKVEESRWTAMMATNTSAFLWLGKHLPGHVRDWGRLIALTSYYSRRYAYRYAALGPSKAAMESLVCYLAVELAAQNVTVNAVAAGMIETETMRANVSAEALEKIAKRTPMRRIGQPEDIAPLVSWLASEESRWVTGQVLTADGGASLMS